MTAPRITSRLEYKMNIGNYESFNIVAGIEADAMEGETVAEAYARISKAVNELLMADVASAHSHLVAKKA